MKVTSKSWVICASRISPSVRKRNALSGQSIWPGSAFWVILTTVLYHCEFRLSLQVPEQVQLEPFQRLEVALPCAACQRADRTIILTQTEPGQHWSGPDHDFPGCLKAVTLERQGGLAKVTYLLEYEFEPFVDAKYPDRIVAPQPSWGRMGMLLTCPCGHAREMETQCNLVKPIAEVCDCGQMLFLEVENALQFSAATVANPARP